MTSMCILCSSVRDFSLCDDHGIHPYLSIHRDGSYIPHASVGVSRDVHGMCIDNGDVKIISTSMGCWSNVQVAHKMEEANELASRERALSRAVAEHEEAAEQLAARAARIAAQAEQVRASADAAEKDRTEATEIRRASEAAQRELDTRCMETGEKMKAR